MPAYDVEADVQQIRIVIEGLAGHVPTALVALALAGCIRDWRDPAQIVDMLAAMLRFRTFAITCGYEVADDCDDLRGDPLFKLAVGRALVSGRDLCFQPTRSRLENAPLRI